MPIKGIATIPPIAPVKNVTAKRKDLLPGKANIGKCPVCGLPIMNGQRNMKVDDHFYHFNCLLKRDSYRYV